MEHAQLKKPLAINVIEVLLETDINICASSCFNGRIE